MRWMWDNKFDLTPFIDSRFPFISKKNSTINTTITVRKVLQGIGVERVFLIHSPKIDSITVLRSSKVRRAKLYYLRNLKGKASRLKQTF